MKWTIRQTTKETGLSADTLRYYEKEGMISPKRHENGYRYYDERDISILKNIVVMKYAHFTLAEMKSMEELQTREANSECSEICKQILNSKITELNQAILKWMPSLSFLNRQLYKYYPDENCDRYFSIAPSCKGCATCQKVCPAGNITMEAGKPNFQHKCEHCLACLHNCPACAIDWKDKTQGKKRYRNAQVSLEELITFNGH